MCGRFAAFSSADAIADRLALSVIADGARLLPPNWNVAPTNLVRIIKPESAAPSRLSLEVARWGLLAPWAKSSSAKSGSALINARVESVAEKPVFAPAFANRRCIVPVDGYYEWQKLATGKQPWYITGESEMLFFAGIYNVTAAIANLTGELSVAILTMPTAPDLAEIHHRMPVSFPAGELSHWIHGSPQEAWSLISDADSHFTKWPVSPQVNSVRNNGPDLIKLQSPPPELASNTELTLF